MVVLGDKEVANNQVNVRTREGENLGVMSVDELIKLVNDTVALKGRVVKKDAE